MIRTSLPEGWVKLIQADNFLLCHAHQLDAAPGCMADLAAERLGLAGCVPLEALGEMSGPEGAVSYGIGKSGFLKEEMTVRELAVRVKDVFGLPFALVYGDELMDQKVSRISVCPGAGGSEIEGALAVGGPGPCDRGYQPPSGDRRGSQGHGHHRRRPLWPGAYLHPLYG